MAAEEVVVHGNAPSYDAVLGLGAALITGGLSFLGGRERNRASAAEAQRNRDFQERMSSTSHQREVADLRAAGLNPILSARGGASTPGGSMATFENELAPAVSSAMQARRLAEDIAQLKQQRDLMKRQEINTSADTELKREQTATQRETQAQIRKLVEKVDAEIGFTKESTAKEAQLTRVAQIEADYGKDVGMLLGLLSAIPGVGRLFGRKK